MFELEYHLSKEEAGREGIPGLGVDSWVRFVMVFLPDMDC